MTRAEPVLSFKALTPLAIAVLLVHLALLQSAALNLNPASSQPGPVFNTRSIELPSKPAQSRQSPASSRPPAHVRRKPAPPRQVEPASPPSDAVQVDAVEPTAPSAMDEKTASMPEVAASQVEVPVDNDQLAPAPRSLREQIGSASNFAVPGSMTLQYQVTSNKFPFSLNSELAWQQDGENYSARLTFGAFGLSRVQTSRGLITAEGLAPLRFSDKYRSEVAAHFVREKGKVTFSANTPDAPLLSGAQDRLSVVMQLAAMMAGAPDRFPPATTIEVQVVGPRAADVWLFTVEDDETLNLAGGQQLTRKLVRNPREAFDQKVELWLAPALAYLPVRLRISDSNGDYADQKWLGSEPPARLD